VIPAPPPPADSGPGPRPEWWRLRFDRACEGIAHLRPNPETQQRLAAVEYSLVEAEGDRVRLVQAVERLDPERVAADLKRALRSGANDDLVLALRRQHETVNGLLNRIEELDQRVTTTLVDVETLAARLTELTLSGLGSGRAAETARAELEQLDLDVTTLAEAHRELADL
jgi:hypothetical protein